MTADELRAIVEGEPEARRMSQQAWARALGIDPSTFRRYLMPADNTNARPIPRVVALAVRHLQRFPDERAVQEEVQAAPAPKKAARRPK